jgi:hypothetical protein
MNHPIVTDLVREQLKHVEKTLFGKRADAEQLDNKIIGLSGHCVDLTNEIDKTTDTLERLRRDLLSAREQVTMLGDVKRDLDAQCQVLDAQVHGFREYLGGQQ